MRLLFTLLLAIFVTLTEGVAQDLLINELMSKNDATIKDEDGDYSDWIEIYNNSGSSVSLLNFGLSDDYSDLGKWKFPDIEIPPNGFLLIFASSKNRISGAELHSNFKLSSSGEDIILSDDTGAILDELELIELSKDQAFGRIPDASESWEIFDRPSPSITNNHSNRLSFSHPVGMYDAPFNLNVNSILPDTIFYTLNGDIPDPESAFFINSIIIEDRDSQPNVFSEIPNTATQDLIPYKAWTSPSELLDKATVLRCSSFKNGVRTSKIYTKTFFVGQDAHSKYTVPIISLVTEGENFFNVDSGIYVPGNLFNPSIPLSTGNYKGQGEAWERDIHIEFFDNDGSLGFAQDAGVRIHGGLTRVATQKSLRLYARKEYGTQHFNYKLLPQREVDKYKRFILRTTMGAWDGETIIKDVLSQNIASSLDIDYQEFQPVIVFLNGEYWGVHTLRDRIDENFISYLNEVDHHSVEIFSDGNSAYQDLESFIENNDLSYLDNYEYVKTKIDIDNYIDYTIVEQFFINYDWPANNMKLWRELPDGKWRWILYDLDAGFGGAHHSMLSHCTLNDPTVNWPNSPESTFLFRNLLKSENFQTQFIQRYTELLCTIFDPEITFEKYRTIKEMYEPEIHDHISRWDFPNSYSSWQNDIESVLRPFLVDRPDYIRHNISSFFDLENYDFSCKIDIAPIADGFILNPNPSTGHFNIYNGEQELEYVNLTICSINGSVVYAESDFAFAKYETKHFNLEHLESGVYIMNLESEVFNKTLKIVLID